VHSDFIQMRSIVKVFQPATVALDGVSVDINQGEIHSVIGENGAGKSTLMKVLYGMVAPDSGEIYFKGQKVNFSSPRDAVKAGIGMIHQEFMLIPSYTIWENVVLGAEPANRLGRLESKEARAQVQALVDEYDLGLSIDERVADVSVGARQKVEILKLLYRDIDTLIMDEPTAVLTPQEIRELFRWVSQAKAAGRTIIFISHKLAEVLEISDRITVMRRGKTITTVENKGLDKSFLARAMVGRDVVFSVSKPPQEPGQTILAAENLHYTDADGQKKLDGVSLKVRRGEIVGLAGVEGNGQFELVQALVGLIQPQQGSIKLKGQEIVPLPISKRRELMSYVPQDRKSWGSAQPLSLQENVIMTHHMTNTALQGRLRWMLSRRKTRQLANTIKEEFEVVVPNIDVPFFALSGGNQQRAIVGREFMLDNDLVILDQPTRGLDVASIEYIQERTLQKRADGQGILLISTDLDELFSLSDRILVMYRGQIVADLRPEETSPEEIGEYMLLGAKGGDNE
jgi:ABC-type uncharacterized transport system ATPase subunit